MPSSESWHKDLLIQMSVPAKNRPAVVTPDLIETLSEFLAFRHLFRGASIVLKRWDKLAPLLAKVDRTHRQAKEELKSSFGFFSWRKAVEDRLPVKIEPGGPNRHRLAVMRKQSRKPAASPAEHKDEEIDRIVTSQAGMDSAWTPSIKVKRFKAASLSIPVELAARATFLAKLHREKAVDKWVERVLRERIELEEFAFAEAKKRLAS